jgi:hypothetical protein
VARVALVGIDTTMRTVCAAASFLQCKTPSHEISRTTNTNIERTGACCTTMLLMIKSSTSMPFASAFDSAFFNKRVMNLTDFSGQRPIYPNPGQCWCP